MQKLLTGCVFNGRSEAPKKLDAFTSNQSTPRAGIAFHQTKYTHLHSCCLLLHIPLFVIFLTKGVEGGRREGGGGGGGGRGGAADSWRHRGGGALRLSVRIFSRGYRRKGAHDVSPILGNSSPPRLVSDLTSTTLAAPDFATSRGFFFFFLFFLPVTLIWVRNSWGGEVTVLLQGLLKTSETTRSFITISDDT